MAAATLPIDDLWAGPMLRRCDEGGVSVWLALREPASVELRLFEESGGQPIARAESRTRVLGDALALCLVTATAALQWGRRYEYELHIDGRPLDTSDLLYPGGPARLSFQLPSDDLQRTSLFHGSCRHPTNEGADALAHLDTLLQASMKGERPLRPELFVCSGDAIYADLPPPFLAAELGPLARRIVGRGETLPSLDRCAEDLAPDERARAIREEARIYEGRPRQLLGFSEYLLSHLLVLSPSLWSLLPEPPRALRDFRSTLPRVRRALANTPYYSIFDDHEVTDDWYLTRAWTHRALSAPLGYRMIRNGLLAYAVVHGWGNRPEQFAPDGPGERLLRALEERDYDSPELGAALGLPTQGEIEDSPAILTGNEGGNHTGDALSYSFRLDTPGYSLIGLDTRTRRTFPGGEHDPSVFLDAREQRKQLPSSEKLQIIVSASPFAPPPRTKTEWGLTHARVFVTAPLKTRFLRRVYAVDRGDEWEPGSESFRTFYENLEGPWLNLGGDTHLSYAAVFESDGYRHPSFVSSGMKRESPARRWRERLGFGYPYPFGSPPIHSLGEVTLRYLPGEGHTKGHYLASNSIGELTFLRSERGLVARHELWHQRDGEVATEEFGELETMHHSIEL